MRVPPRLPDGWRRAMQEAVAHELGRDVALEVLGSGLDCWAVRAGEVVLRIPQHDDGAASVERQTGILDALAPRIPVPIPRPLFTVGNPLGPGSVAACRYVPGDAVDEDDWHRDGLLHDANIATIAGIVDAVASFAADDAVDLGVPRRDRRPELAAELSIVRQVVVPLLDGRTAARLVDRWESHLADDRQFPERSGLIHGDLSLDHLLITDGRISGVIDFGDIAVTDPDLELGYLWAEGGPRTVERVQSHRRRPVDDVLVAKLEFFQVRDEAADVRWAVEYGLADLLPGAIAAITTTLARPLAAR